METPDCFGQGSHAHDLPSLTRLVIPLARFRRGLFRPGGTPSFRFSPDAPKQPRTEVPRPRQTNRCRGRTLSCSGLQTYYYYLDGDGLGKKRTETRLVDSNECHLGFLYIQRLSFFTLRDGREGCIECSCLAPDDAKDNAIPG
ncbi:hypothetical protein LY78DRAFT_233923 [Colletotrichum sublineola]|nr:hypothetical protein LY78DRAFT_233923 [Colletotrichum sublineola]